MEASAASLRRRYETAFRSLLQRARPARLQRGVALLFEKAERRVAEGEDPAAALLEVYQRCRQQTIRRLCRLRAESAGPPGGGAEGCAVPRESPEPAPSAGSRRARLRRGEQLRQLLESRLPPVPHGLQGDEPSPDFHCDAGLGGLARWLRAAGYDARFWPGVPDDELLERVLASDAIMLTTDRPLAARAAVRWGVVPALLVPLGPGKREQLEMVASRLQLPRHPARCMQCGGPLDRVDKQAVRAEIPPRTYPWCDHYYRCRRCGKLFWRGTHWKRIDEFLERITSESSQLS